MYAMVRDGDRVGDELSWLPRAGAAGAGPRGQGACGLTQWRLGYGRLSAPRPQAPPSRWKRTVRNLVIGLTVLIGLTFALTTTVHGRTPQSQRTVTVGRGQTIWSIAQTYEPNQDPRQAVQEIERLNHLPSTAVHVGDRLVVPSD